MQHDIILLFFDTMILDHKNLLQGNESVQQSSSLTHKVAVYAFKNYFENITAPGKCSTKVRSTLMIGI